VVVLPLTFPIAWPPSLTNAVHKGRALSLYAHAKTSVIAARRKAKSSLFFHQQQYQGTTKRNKIQL
jgi:hypothetical protein